MNILLVFNHMDEGNFYDSKYIYKIKLFFIKNQFGSTKKNIRT